MHQLQRSWVHSGIWGAADEAVLNIVRTKKEKNPPQKKEKKKKNFFSKFWYFSLENLQNENLEK